MYFKYQKHSLFPVNWGYFRPLRCSCVLPRRALEWACTYCFQGFSLMLFTFPPHEWACTQSYRTANCGPLCLRTTLTISPQSHSNARQTLSPHGTRKNQGVNFEHTRNIVLRNKPHEHASVAIYSKSWRKLCLRAISKIF